MIYFTIIAGIIATVGMCWAVISLAKETTTTPTEPPQAFVGHRIPGTNRTV